MVHEHPNRMSGNGDGHDKPEHNPSHDQSHNPGHDPMRDSSLETLASDVTRAREQGDRELLRERLERLGLQLEDTHGTVNYTLFSQVLRDEMNDEEIDAICMELSMLHAIAGYDHEDKESSRGEVSVVEALPAPFGAPIADGRLRYELRRFVGQGTQGIVYEAHDLAIHDPDHPAMVALKVLRAHTLDAMALSEASLARRLNHPGIARVFDAGQSARGEHYIAYELLRGRALDDWHKTNSETLPETRCVEIVDAVCDALVSAHAMGIVHRDIKPSNIIMRDDAHPVLTDFGIAHAMQSRNIRNSKSHGTRGSLAFMAPEQYTGESSSRSVGVDVYACGGLLLWLLTGNYPNGSDARSACAYLERPPEGGPLGAIRRVRDPRLAHILTRALCPDPAQRYTTIEGLRGDLRRWLGHEALPGMGESLRVRTRLALKRDRKPFVWGGVLAACLALFVGLLWSASVRSARRHADMALALLESELELQQQTQEQYRIRAAMVHEIIRSWGEASGDNFRPEEATTNMLFLHSVSQYGPLMQDETFLDDILHDKLRVAQQYLAHVEEQGGSPIQLALWHDLIAYWGDGLALAQQREHLQAALDLVRAHAPGDTVWLTNLEARLADADAMAGE